MTKKKVIEDIVRHAATIPDDGNKWIPQFYVGNNLVANGYCLYKDEELPETEYKNTLTDDAISKMDYVFSDSTLRELSEAIEIDKNVLKDWIKTHKRNDPERKPFIIELKKENESRFVCINAWYLRNQFEYLKDNRIFIQPDKFRRYGNPVYIGGVYSFSDDFQTTMCMTLPVNWDRMLKADYLVEEKI